MRINLIIVLGLLLISNSSLADVQCSGQEIKNPISGNFSLCIFYSEENERVDKLLLTIFKKGPSTDLESIHHNYNLSNLNSVVIENGSTVLTFSGQKKGPGNRWGLIKVIFDRVGNHTVVTLPSR